MILKLGVTYFKELFTEFENLYPSRRYFSSKFGCTRQMGPKWGPNGAQILRDFGIFWAIKRLKCLKTCFRVRFYEYLAISRRFSKKCDFCQNGGPSKPEFWPFWPKIEDFRILLICSVPKLEITGALGKPKMGHVIDKTSVYKLRAAILEIFIFRPIRADFRSKSAKIAEIWPKIGPYGPKNENFQNRRT